MARKTKNDDFTSDIRNTLKDSESLHQPVKTFFAQCLERVLLGIVATITALLLSPFTWRSIVCETLALILAILFAWHFLKIKSTAFRVWFVALTMLPLATFCPFIVIPKPIYFARIKSENPLDSKMFLLKSGGRTIGSVILISDLDYARIAISYFLNNHFPASFPTLERTDYQTGSYYSIPILKGFVFDLGEPGEIISKRSIYFPCVLLEKGLSYNLDKPKLVTTTTEPQNHFNFQCGLNFGSLINFAYVQYPDTIPWDAVQIQNGQDTSIAIYTALLDRALGFLASGNTEEAINGLDSAITILPRQNLEGARLAALKYSVIKQSFRGNVGDMQCLPALHKAYELFMQSRNDPRFSEKDPLANWLQDLIMGGYQYWSWTAMFYDRVLMLEAIPHLEDSVAGENRYTDKLENEFKGKSYNETLTMLQSKNYSTAELHFIKYLVFSKFIQFSLSGIGSSTTNSDTALVKSAFELKNLIPILHFIDTSLARKHGLQSDPFSAHMLDFVQYIQIEFPKISADASEAKIAQFFNSRAKDNQVMADFSNLYKVAMSEHKFLTNGTLSGLKSQWWKSEYVIWFTWWSLNAVHEIERHDYPWSNCEPPEFNLHELVLKFGNDYFTKDTGGKGRTFLPGLFFLAWYEQTFDIEGSVQLKEQFEAETKIPFDLFRSNLYPPEEQ